MPDTYEIWLNEVRSALHSINMPMDDWQRMWSFGFEREYKGGVTPNDAAAKANRFWWQQQNRSVQQDCRKTPDCWLPRDHQGECQNV